MTHVATIGTATAITAVSSLAIPVTAAVPTGRTVIGAVAWESTAGTIPTISSITDSRGNTWTVTPDAAAGGASNVTVATVIIRARITTALQAGDTVTVTISSGTRTRWVAQLDHFDDVNTSPLDKTAHNDNPGSSTALSTGATTATAQNYELLVAAFAFGLPAARTVTIPGGWSGGAQVATAAGSTNRALQLVWQYSAATGTQQGTITLDAASTYCGAIATYKATSLAPPVGRVSQVKLTIPPPGVASVGRVSQVKLQVPPGAIGVGRVSQLRLTVPALAGQAPYSGLKVAAGGTLKNASIRAPRDGTV
jgi:hypothetical protein